MADQSKNNRFVHGLQIGTLSDAAVILCFHHSTKVADPPEPLDRSPTFVLTKEAALQLARQLFDVAERLPDQSEDGNARSH